MNWTSLEMQACQILQFTDPFWNGPDSILPYKTGSGWDSGLTLIGCINEMKTACIRISPDLRGLHSTAHPNHASKSQMPCLYWGFRFKSYLQNYRHSLRNPNNMDSPSAYNVQSSFLFRRAYTVCSNAQDPMRVNICSKSTKTLSEMWALTYKLLWEIMSHYESFMALKGYWRHDTYCHACNLP